MNKPTTARAVNAALKRAGIPLEFVSTRQGYQYFVFDDGADRFETHSVYVPYVSDWSVARWIECARYTMEKVENPPPVRW
jgi:hypothetical protein